MKKIKRKDLNLHMDLGIFVKIVRMSLKMANREKLIFKWCVEKNKMKIGNLKQLIL